eukprot:TRINITY_DN10204_c0_g1_i1.p1 TRINITY_DN10204_c0_g1~~TRINITY_DN10204_c0_g1_i1.p1  ORF type:complete len:444 (+),score=73.68 TRINITY_DN10204_c0_g1_i1:42-1334(+)
MHQVLLTLIICAAITPAFSAHCSPNSQLAKENTHPIWSEPPQLLKTTTNGKLFGVGPNNFTKILHVWGTPYEKGFAHGTLLKEDAINLVTNLWEYLEAQFGTSISPYLPTWLVNLGLEGALEAFYFMTKPYTGSYIFEELEGLSAATGIPYSRLVQIHMIGEITKGRCSMYGAWGNSIPTKNGLLQLRALDWDTDGPYKDHPLITVYHAGPNDLNQNTFLNVGFSGWIGSITGMSSSQMGISEIGVSYPDDTFGDENPFGIPFVFLLRDILQFDQSLDDALNRMINAQRTVHLILGVGDGKIPAFRSIQYSHSKMQIMDDNNMMPYNETWHPRIKDIVYYGMDWICPGYDLKLSEELKDFYGNITAENTIRYITALVQTGDLHVAVYDLTQNKIFASFAAPSWSNDVEKYAYQRQFMEIDTAALWNEPRP